MYGKVETKSLMWWQNWQIRDRGQVSGWRVAAFRAGAIIVALLISGLIAEMGGASAIEVAHAIGRSISTYGGFAEVLVVAAPVVMTGLAVALALRAHLWNLGGDGQLLMGAWAAAGVGLNVEAPVIIVFILMAIAAATAGGIWAGIAAVARARWHVSELLVTLLLNFVAGLWTLYFVTGPWRAANFGSLAATDRIPYSIPAIASGRGHIGFLVPLMLAAVLLHVLRHTKWGYELSVVGEGHKVARYATIGLRARVTQVLIVSGMIAGLAGSVEVVGTLHRLTTSVTNNYGLYGVIVAVIAHNSPIGVVVTGFAVGVLLNAGIAIRSLGVSPNIVLVANALVLLAVVVTDVVARYGIQRRNADVGDLPKDGTT